jgi:hypothetical protein
MPQSWERAERSRNAQEKRLTQESQLAAPDSSSQDPASVQAAEGVCLSHLRHSEGCAASHCRTQMSGFSFRFYPVRGSAKSGECLTMLARLTLVGG